MKSADGVTRGSYSYVDANGLLQTVNYISDAMGFRVAATNLPVHHVEGLISITLNHYLSTYLIISTITFYYNFHINCVMGPCITGFCIQNRKKIEKNILKAITAS